MASPTLILFASRTRWKNENETKTQMEMFKHREKWDVKLNSNTHVHVIFPGVKAETMWRGSEEKKTQVKSSMSSLWTTEKAQEVIRGKNVRMFFFLQ